MITIIKSKTSKDELNRIIGSLKSRNKLLNASKYSGKIKITDSPLAIQKKLRNEWA